MTEGLQALPDRRDPALTTYPSETLTWTVIQMFVCRLGARRQIRFRLTTPQAVRRMNALAGQKLDSVPHGDTIEEYLADVDPDDVQKIPQAMVRALVEARRLEKFRLLDRYYLVTADMTGHLVLGDRPSDFTDGCLTQTLENGRTVYFRPVCEAKLVTRTGLALSLASEFVENVPRKNRSEEQYKQDGEKAAMPRLLRRIKQAFPTLAICLLVDSLHCNEPTFQSCQDHDWRFIAVLKEGALPSVLREFEALSAQTPENSLAIQTPEERLAFRWVNAIAYHKRTVNVLECIVTVPSKEPIRFVWVTDIPITRQNCEVLSQQGGRQRWRTENEGFRTQKHGGFEMEHAYAKRPASAKNFYLLLQAAHILAQMFEVYCQGKRAVQHRFGSLRNLAHALLESWRRDPLPEPQRLRVFFEQAIQIRMDTS